MRNLKLILFSKVGCCLCEGLEEKLRSICLEDIYPKLQFCVKDIDTNQVTELERARYLLEVPVLVIESQNKELTLELPRVSARLKKEALMGWLQRHFQEKINLI